jgi:hypothetical protein
MTGGLNKAELEDIQVFYERWLNLSDAERESTREELSKEGIDMIRLGDAIRDHNKSKNK